jgi:aminoglycoside phosphotransferase (APT) family kinase protein
LFSLDDGEWVVAAFEEIDGSPPSNPWTSAELEAVLSAVEAMVAMADPSPVTGPAPAADYLAGQFGGFATLLADRRSGVEPWVARHLDRLAAAEAPWPDVVNGTGLVHLDVRSDNVLLTTGGDVVFVDWANAVIGAPWIDAVCMLPSVALEGGPAPEEVWSGRSLSAMTDPDAVTTLVVAIAGYFTERALLPPPPGIPHVRRFQRAQAEVCWRWIEARTGWS